MHSVHRRRIYQEGGREVRRRRAPEHERPPRDRLHQGGGPRLPFGRRHHPRDKQRPFQHQDNLRSEEDQLLRILQHRAEGRWAFHNRAAGDNVPCGVRHPRQPGGRPSRSRLEHNLQGSARADGSGIRERDRQLLVQRDTVLRRRNGQRRGRRGQGAGSGPVRRHPLHHSSRGRRPEGHCDLHGRRLPRRGDVRALLVQLPPGHRHGRGRSERRQERGGDRHPRRSGALQLGELVEHRPGRLFPRRRSAVHGRGPFIGDRLQARERLGMERYRRTGARVPLRWSVQEGPVLVLLLHRQRRGRRAQVRHRSLRADTQGGGCSRKRVSRLLHRMLCVHVVLRAIRHLRPPLHQLQPRDGRDPLLRQGHNDGRLPQLHPQDGLRHGFGGAHMGRSVQRMHLAIRRDVP